MCNDKRRNVIKSDKHREDEEDCEDTDEIEDLIQPPTKYEVMEALKVLQICTFYDADVGDEMRAKVNTFWKRYHISMTKAERQKTITDFFVHNEHNLLSGHKHLKSVLCVIKRCWVK